MAHQKCLASQKFLPGSKSFATDFPSCSWAEKKYPSSLVQPRAKGTQVFPQSRNRTNTHSRWATFWVNSSLEQLKWENELPKSFMKSTNSLLSSKATTGDLWFESPLLNGVTYPKWKMSCLEEKNP